MLACFVWICLLFTWICFQPSWKYNEGGVLYAIKDLSLVTVLCFAADVFLQWMTAITIKGIVFSAHPVI